MATVKGILGQAAPSSGVDTDLYTVPTSKTATVKVVCANRAATAFAVIIRDGVAAMRYGIMAQKVMK